MEFYNPVLSEEQAESYWWTKDQNTNIDNA